MYIFIALCFGTVGNFAIAVYCLLGLTFQGRVYDTMLSGRD